MATTDKTKITVSAKINAPVEKVWELWTEPKHIIHWNYASDDWHTPEAENDLRVGGKFVSRMEAKDGSMGFDFSGKYSKVEKFKHIDYTMDDYRTVQLLFESKGNETTVTETFEAEDTNTIELQKGGWQSILNNFKKYAETAGNLDSLHFEININAKVENVYKTMLNEKSYCEWTAEFNATSHYNGSWEKGSKMLFLGTDHEGKMGGMVSRIKENTPSKFVSIEHLGIVKDGKEVFAGPEIDEWVGALENYTFVDDNGKTKLLIDMQTQHEINAEFKSYFNDAWPKALKKLKTICEQ